MCDRCNCGQFPIILGLFGASLPILKEPLVNYTTEDDIMMLYLSLLKDFAENHLSRLTDQICVLLYNVSYSVLQHCYNLFHSIHYGSETTKNTDNLSNRRVDLSIAILELLNSLAAKDFLFSDEASYEFLGNLQNEVSTVLLFGLQSILEIITMDMIRSLPLLAEKFYSFVAFLCSTYSNSVVQWVNSSASNSMSHEVLLNKFLSYLLLGMQVVDGITSRQALQVTQLYTVT